jgi:phosphoribosylformylglycinamidine synthase I
MTRIAVVVFPGTNCMYETRDALRAAGAEVTFLNWQATRQDCSEFDGFVLPGGFSYEDRVRAGVIAAKHAVVEGVAEAAEEGKPILGICNGAQVLVEAGLVPGLHAGNVEIALGRNADAKWNGYYCEWVHLQAPTPRGIFEEIAKAGLVLPMPVGHGEGRFVGDPELFNELARKGQVALQYVNAQGAPANGFPDNPNASLLNVAGLCDPTGRVVAMMPHPERAAWLYQVPESLVGAWGDRRRAADHFEPMAGKGPGQVMYDCFVKVASESVVKNS